MLAFNLWKTQQNSQWYFNIKGGNGEKVAQSEGYVNRQGAAHAIDLIRNNAATAPVYEYRNDKWERIV